MTTATADNTEVIGGVDTHQDLHTAAVVSHDGAVLDTESFSTTRAGYRAMLRLVSVSRGTASRWRGAGDGQRAGTVAVPATWRRGRD